MKRRLCLIFLINSILFGQSFGEVYDRIERFVVQETIERQNREFIVDFDLDSLVEAVENSDDDQKDIALHILYRFSLIVNGYSGTSLSIGKASLENSLNLENRVFSKYAVAYYRYTARNFNIWTRTLNVFTGIGDDYELGSSVILEIDALPNKFNSLLLRDQIDILVDKFSDLPQAIAKLKQLYDITRNQFVLTHYLNMNYRHGFYEEFINRSNDLDTLKSGMQRKLMRAHIKMGNFSEAGKVLKNVQADSADIDLKMQSAHIYFYNLNQNINIEELEDENLYYGYDAEEVFNRLEVDQHIYRAEFYLNQSNHDATINFIDKELNNNNLAKDEYHYFRAVVFWKNKDYFNAKRLIHNLLNNNDEIHSRYKSNANLILAQIAYLTNDTQNMESYLKEIDLDNIRPEWIHIYQFLIKSSR